MKWKDIRNHREIVTEIIKTEKPRVVAEIGVWKSSLIKQALRSCGDIVTAYWGVDPWKHFDSYEEFEPDMARYSKTTPDGWDNAYLYACKLMYYFPQLRILRLQSTEAAKLFPSGHFDLVFIDADHRYDGALDDVRAWLPLVKKGGIISGHDYKPSHPGVMQAIDETFGKDVTIIQDSSVWMKKI